MLRVVLLLCKVSQVLNSHPSNSQPTTFSEDTVQNSLFLAAPGFACKMSWVGPKKFLVMQISDLSDQLISVGKDQKIQHGLAWLRKLQDRPKKNLFFHSVSFISAVTIAGVGSIGVAGHHLNP